MRKLNNVEQAFTIINNFYPFSAVCVLKLRPGPKQGVMRSILERLQHIHPLLQVMIKEKGGRFWFEKDKDTRPVPLLIVDRENDNHWQEIVCLELNKGFSSGTSPLMRVNYLVSGSNSGNAEIILSFHHAIIDAESLLFIIDQLLTMAGKNAASPESNLRLPVAPDLAEVLPPSFRGIRLVLNFLPFIFRQMIDEINYRRELKKVKDPDIPSSSVNDILTLSFSREETSELIKWSRKKKLSLNSIISAAMLIVVNRYSYNGRKKLLRTVQFGNLRHYLHSPVPAEAGGCFVAMMRFSVPLIPEADVQQVAENLDHQFIKSSRRGDKFLYALLSKILAKKTIRALNARLGSTALSYAGPVQLKQQFGEIQLTGLHGFITNNCLGAEFTGFGKIFGERLSIDLNFLTAETTKEKAIEMAEAIRSLLMQSIKGK